MTNLSKKLLRYLILLSFGSLSLSGSFACIRTGIQISEESAASQGSSSSQSQNYRALIVVNGMKSVSSPVLSSDSYQAVVGSSAALKGRAQGDSYQISEPLLDSVQGALGE